MCFTETLSSRTHPRTHLDLRIPPMQSPFCPPHTRRLLATGLLWSARCAQLLWMISLQS